MPTERVNILIDKKHILDEIKRTAELNSGVPLGKAMFFKETGIRHHDWFGKYWAKWSDALIEAGYQPNKFNDAYDDRLAIEKLVNFINEIGKFPSTGELHLKANSDDTFPSYRIFSRIGKKNILIQKVIQYCTGVPELEKVLEICKSIPATNQIITNNRLMDNPVFEYVYLMKSGQYHKIGRANSVGRREYELGIQLPEKVTTVHTIKTDDAMGIEAYWHNRFKSKRKNGEWFELTPDDVNAFKRRNFM